MPLRIDLMGGPDLPLKDSNALLCILEDYLYFLKPVRQVCPPIAYFSIMNLYKLGNCVCKWVGRCLTTNRCTCGCVITGFAFLSAHFLKQPSSHPYLSVPSLPPQRTRTQVCGAARCLSHICSRAAEEASPAALPPAPVRPHPLPTNRKGNGVISSSSVSGSDCLLCL